VRLLFETPNVVSLMLQPLAYVGRARRFGSTTDRLTLPDVIGLVEGSKRVKASDFTPLPCSHPLCFSLAFYLILDDGTPSSLAQWLDTQAWLGVVANRGVFGLDPEQQTHLRDLVYRVWSGPAACDPSAQAVLDAVRSLLRAISASGFDARRVFRQGERRLKSIFVHAFQDPDTFDLARVRRCCNGYPQPDGRVIPVCVRNNLRNPGGRRQGD